MSASRVVVAVDGSDPASGALEWAALEAGAQGRALHLVHVVDEPDSPGRPAPDGDERDAGLRVLGRALERLPVDVAADATVEVLQGPVAETVARAAGAGDTLVIGTHKTGFLRGRVLGSRSLVVAAHATATLVVVPPSGITAPRHTVVVGLTPRLDWAPLIDAAGALAGRRGHDLQLVHAGIEPKPLPSHDLTREDAGLIGLASASRHVADRHPGIPVRTRASSRSAAEAFLDASRNAALLAIGVPSARRAERFTGCVAHDVVLNINSPVMLVPSEDVPADASLSW